MDCAAIEGNRNATLEVASRAVRVCSSKVMITSFILR